jgi:hypothetical protein
MAKFHLFFSEKCTNCDFFLLQLKNNEDIYKKVNLISVHTKNIDLPESVESVPHMIIVDSMGNEQNNIVGQDLFRWLAQQKNVDVPMPQHETTPTIIDDCKYLNFDPYDATSSFSNINDPESTSGDRFEYVQNNNSMATTTASTSRGNEGRQQKTADFDDRMRQMQEERKLN